ncbi:glyoxalase [Kitasatospora sp. MMS16-BH015]|uniref:VOC family protein n=1 Tax=Kitasatospora sp. MMS16-BH015 TaxID=2018025 RepID=UPI000CA34EF9|nr:VOC family protein [Kitasatospora sp. MMS16-BH015]AUG80956.1 glyoxalase [Kitasatospora sp. MMS16-BH015]
MIGELHVVTVDCPDPAALAGFYRELLGLAPTVDTGQYVVLADPAGRAVLALQQVPEYHPPRWPEAAHPAQLHLDVLVPDLDVAEPKVLALGATLLDGSDKPVGYRVYADPVGHPFCLVTPESL